MGGEILAIVFADAERSTELLVERGDDAGRAALADVEPAVRRLDVAAEFSACSPLLAV